MSWALSFMFRLSFHASHAHLWPYALRLACTEWNKSPNMKDSAQLIPEQAFTKVKVNNTFENSVLFGCPVYVLAQKMQDGGHQNKWKEISRISIYLGQSPDHARNVALVLDQTTCFVSPQYHVQFDRAFDAVQEKSRGTLDLIGR